MSFSSFSAGRRRVLLGLVSAAALLASASPGWADKVYSKWGAAIGGADPVAYFTMGKTVDGSKKHTLEWQGATWRFANAAHLEQFKAAPERYAPQYGGYCAWAVSEGYTAKIDPEAWEIVDGKLYLNYSKGIQKRWAADKGGNIAKADSNWPKIRAGL